MNLSPEFWPELLAFVLTLLVLSYIIGDNPFYRVAIHLFLGVAAAYITILTLQGVLWPRLDALYKTALDGDFFTAVILAIPWMLAFLILLRASASMAPIGNVAIAFMVGVGAALAVGGAIMGTIIPQVYASWSEATPTPSSNLAQTLIFWAPSVLGTVFVLLYFLYAGRNTPAGRGERPRLLTPVTWAGQGFLTVALAALYVGTLAASFALLVERVGAMYLFITGPDVGEILHLIGL